MPQLEAALAGAGLTDKEAKVYLAALELGNATATHIARKAGINRATTYLVAENLILRGLMSSVHNDTKRQFVAEPPTCLLGRLKKEEETVGTRVQTLESALPELEALVKADTQRPVVRYYEGVSGLETMREILYRHRHGEIVSAIDLDLLQGALSVENLRAHQKRMKLYDLGGRVLYTCSDAVAEKLISDSPSKGTHEHRRVSRDTFPFAGEVVIFGNTVALISYGEKIIGSIVEHQHFAKTIRALFELAWRSAAPAR